MKEAITIFTVVRDKAMYAKCIADNVCCSSLRKIEVDNTLENKSIAQRYNAFLEEFDYAHPGWIVFCHEDFELREYIVEKLRACSPDCLYGPCGARHVKYLNLVARWQTASRITETWKDGSHSHFVGTKVKDFTQLDTTDCMCLIVHSSLVERYKLRFDPRLNFDLYTEDFCANAMVSHGVKTLALNLDCVHHSTRDKLPPQYFESLEYLNRKYPNDAFGGTCSYVGGSKLARNFCGPFLRLLRIIIK